MRYQLCDLVLASELPLAELTTAPDDAQPEIAVYRGGVVTQRSGDHEWFHEWRYPDGELWTSFARIGGSYVCRFAGLADFHLEDEGNHITCYPVAGVPDHTLGHILLNQVMPIVFSANRDRLVLHASAVAIDERAVGFLGETGQGKSTLAGSFCRAGFPLVTDDFLVLTGDKGRPMVVPTYAGLRLWDDTVPVVAAAGAAAPGVAHFTDKKRISGPEHDLPFASTPLVLDRLFLLGADLPAGAAVSIEEIPPRAALLQLTRYTFHLDLRAGAVRRAEFERLGELVASVPVFRLGYPRTLAELPLVRTAIIEHGRSVARI